MATDAWAGIGGAVESLGIGATPAGQYGSGDNQDDCTRAKVDHSSPETMGEFIRDYYGIRPADFVVMDGLQGLEHGPLPAWDDSGTYDYQSSITNMRLILACGNAVAVELADPGTARHHRGLRHEMPTGQGSVPDRFAGRRSGHDGHGPDQRSRQEGERGREAFRREADGYLSRNLTESRGLAQRDPTMPWYSG